MACKEKAEIMTVVNIKKDLVGKHGIQSKSLNGVLKADLVKQLVSE